MIWSLQHWVRAHNLFELLNGLSTFIGSHEWFVLFGEFGEWADDLSIAFYKRAIVPKGSQSGLHFVYVLEFLVPFCKSVDLCRVNAQLPPFDSDPVTAPRGRVADKRSSWFLRTWATAGKFHRF